MDLPTESALRQGTATSLWHELIRDGEQRRHLVLGESLQAYLVFALMRHLGDADLIGRTMALEWLRAQEPPTRPDRLRDVGDRCLLIAGLFPRLADRRRVSNDYFIDIGRGAYSNAARRAPRCERGLFAELALAFGSLVEVLGAIRPEAANGMLSVPAQTRRARSLH
jgi:hypothetical protein